MIYVYTPEKTPTALALTAALQGKLIRNFDGMNFLQKGKLMAFNPDDVVVCWGKQLPKLDTVRIINSHDSLVGNLQLQKRLQTIASSMGLGYVAHYATTPEQLAKVRADIEAGKGTKMYPLKHLPGYWGTRYNLLNEYKFYAFRDGPQADGNTIKLTVPLIKTTNGFRKPWHVTPTNNVSVTLLERVAMIFNQLKLDFATITLSLVITSGGSGVTVARKVITAPELAPDEVTLFANEINRLIKGV